MADLEERKRLLGGDYEFDYNVAFPSLSSSGRWEGGAGPDGAFSGKEMLVFLFGWGGCKDKYLDKYSNIYQDLGCISVRYILPPEVVLFHRHELLEVVGENLYNLFDELGLKGHPILFHVFSGNGASTYNALNEALKGKPDEEEVRALFKGIVFDSCPSYINNWQRAKAYVASTNPRLSGWKLYLLLWIGFVGFSCYDLFRVIRSLFGGPPYPHYYQQLQKDQHLPKEQLYLFSDSDEICSSSSIAAFIARQKMRGANVRAQCWPDSPHCQHYRIYPQEYTKQVAEFLGSLNQ